MHGDGLDIGIVNESVDGDPFGDLIADRAMPDSDGGIDMIDDPNDPFDDVMDDALDDAF